MLNAPLFHSILSRSTCAQVGASADPQPYKRLCDGTPSPSSRVRARVTTSDNGI